LAKILLLYHDGMAVEYKGQYYEVGVFPMGLDEYVWASHVRYYILEKPKDIERFGHKLEPEVVEDYKEYAQKPGHKEYLRILLGYYPELEPYIHEAAKPL